MTQHPRGMRGAASVATAGVALVSLLTVWAVAGVGATPLPSAGSTASDAAAHIEGPPPGHTGGFGEPSCLTCHSSYRLNVGGSVTVEGLPDAYEPGATYVVSVVLRSTEMEAAGFQASARFVAGEGEPGPDRGRPAGHLTPVDERTAVVPDSAAMIPYAQHVAASTRVADPELASWSFEWKAPAAGSGDVVFHAAANSANGDNSPLADLVYTTRKVVRAGTSPTPE